MQENLRVISVYDDDIEGKSPQINRKMSILALLFASLCVNLAFGIILPFLPIYVDLIATDIEILGMIFEIGFQVGILTSAFMISRCILAPTFGQLSDAKGRKPIILIGMAIYGFLCMGFAFSTDILTLFIVRLGQGVASAAVWPVAESLVADLSDERDFGKYMGWYILSMQLGWASGPFFGAAANIFIMGTGFVTSTITSMQIIFFSVAGLSFVSVPLIFYFVQDPKITQRFNLQDVKETVITMLKASVRGPIIFGETVFKAIKRNPDPEEAVPRGIYGMALANGFGFALIWPIMTLFYLDYYIPDINVVLTIIGIASVIGLVFNPIGGYIADRTSRKNVVVGVGLCSVVMTLILGLEVTIFVLFILILVRQAVFSILMPAFRALQAEVVPKRIRGEIFGVVQALFNVGGVFGPIVGGILYDMFPGRYVISLLGLEITVFGTIIVFAVTSILTLMGVLMILLFVRVTKSPKTLKEGTHQREADLLIEQEIIGSESREHT